VRVDGVEVGHTSGRGGGAARAARGDDRRLSPGGRFALLSPDRVGPRARACGPSPASHASWRTVVCRQSGRLQPRRVSSRSTGEPDLSVRGPRHRPSGPPGVARCHRQNLRRPRWGAIALVDRGPLRLAAAHVVKLSRQAVTIAAEGAGASVTCESQPSSTTGTEPLSWPESSSSAPNPSSPTCCDRGHLHGSTVSGGGSRKARKWGISS